MSFMEKMRGYGRTMEEYGKTPKGHHDLFDYAGAVVLIVVSIAAMVGFAFMILAKVDGSL